MPPTAPQAGLTLEHDEYLRMAAVEDRMWWYRALHAWLLRALPVEQTPVLDAGCGTGGFLRRLAESRPATSRIGVEFMPPAARIALARSATPICVGSVNGLPVREASVGAVVSADVLCHGKVDQQAALAEFRRVLAPGGVLVLNLPAFRWMFSAHDRAVHTTRRYTRAEVAALLTGAGFRVVRVRYWNSLLFPLMMLQRLVLARNAAASDVRLYPAPIEALFRAVTAIERGLNLSLPFGGSVLAVAQKP
jgi:ubiquinone/menaquinone biosynthesis C-methylase UbiE